MRMKKMEGEERRDEEKKGKGNVTKDITI